MSKPVRIKVDSQPQPNLRKLARALLQLVEQQNSGQAATPPEEKAS